MLRIKEIETFKNITEECENINLIIGSNNSGKTFFLKEIYNCINDVSVPKDSKWVNRVKIKSDNLKKDVTELMPKIYAADNFESVRSIRDADFKPFSPNISTGSDIWNEHVFNEARQLLEEEREHEITKTKNQDSRWYFWRFVLNSLITLEDCGQRLGGPFNTTVNDLLAEPENNIFNYLF